MYTKSHELDIIVWVVIGMVLPNILLILNEYSYEINE